MHPRGRDMTGRSGSPGRRHWCTCPGSPHCSEFHLALWVPVPLPSSALVHGTWVHTGQWDHYTVEAIHNNAPDTGRHCRLSTAGLWSLLHLEDNPGSREKVITLWYITQWQGPREGWMMTPESQETSSTYLPPGSHLVPSSCLFLKVETDSIAVEFPWAHHDNDLCKELFCLLWSLFYLSGFFSDI